MFTVPDILFSAPVLAELSRTTEDQPESLHSGSSDIQNAALQATKFVFDLSVQSEFASQRYLEALLSAVSPSEAPQTRSQARKRKRTPSPCTPEVTFNPTPVDSLFIEGMDDDQIWSQLDLRNKTICEVLDNILDKEPDEEDLEREDLGSEEEDEDEDDEYGEEIDEKIEEAIRRTKNGENVDFAELGLDEELKELLLEGALDNDEDDSGLDDDDDDEGGAGSEDSEDSNVEEQVVLLGSSSDNGDEQGPQSSMANVIAHQNSARSKERGRPGRSELDDDFFDLNAFNSQTEQGEARTASAGILDGGDEDEEDDEVDFFAPVDLENLDGEDSENNASMLYYNDFFKTARQAKRPPKPTTVRFRDEVRVKKIKAKGKNLPLPRLYGNGEEDEKGEEDEDEWDAVEEDGNSSVDEDADMEMEDEEDGSDASEDFADFQRDAISRAKDDLFADDEDEEPQKDLSTHEKRMATLKKQILELEAENVGPKDWVLMGEADSRSRPQNSLLEEDLEFDRAMKSIPVITEEVVKSLEERIKARILENRFDDVVRIRPLDDKPFLPSRLFELKDTKSTQSLAQIYEDEYVAAQTGGVTGDDRNAKLKKEHEEVEKLWESICYKLDALCNTHFTPKQPKATISTISNVSTATLESALPTAQSVNTMLAPEEVFASSSSSLRARSELTPSEKQSLHRKERKAKKKTRDALNLSTDKYARVQKSGSLKKQKDDALKSVVKTGKGVTVVGKKKKDILGKPKHT
ncbi:U3 small nucleolar ribonucleoprotein complex, subunit Mpp10 [Lentinula aciculospora]|uniref:U3 small nucleolar ribonucleoprotein protein MPP10 n=1 Tax=Lentinula aciculospora TaxID=153920 RepID=A0A9W9AQP3_9AGAR|nr:U3 small nucleolar ribonucleoprotein complex, subunit Mpp10 [Lentinula aciculospora]